MKARGVRMDLAIAPLFSKGTKENILFPLYNGWPNEIRLLGEFWVSVSPFDSPEPGQWLSLKFPQPLCLFSQDASQPVIAQFYSSGLYRFYAIIYEQVHRYKHRILGYEISWFSPYILKDGVTYEPADLTPKLTLNLQLPIDV